MRKINNLLLPSRNDVYLLAMARSQEILKGVQEDKMSSKQKSNKVEFDRKQLALKILDGTCCDLHCEILQQLINNKATVESDDGDEGAPGSQLVVYTSLFV